MDVSAAHGVAVIAAAANRILAAADLANRYPNARIVFSGGSPNLPSDTPEKPITRHPFSKAWASPGERLIIERRSRNTEENAEFSKAIAAPKAGERWLLVTSAYHMPRSMGLFRKAGFAVEAYPVDWRVGGPADLLRFTGFSVDGARPRQHRFPRMDRPYRLLGHRQDRPVAARAVPGLKAGLSHDKPNRARIGGTGTHRFSPPISGSLRHATTIAAGTIRFARHGGRSEQSASSQDHGDRHEDVRRRRGDGGDSEDPATDRRPHHRPDRQHGLAAGLDRRHHR